MIRQDIARLNSKMKRRDIFYVIAFIIVLTIGIVKNILGFISDYQNRNNLLHVPYNEKGAMEYSRRTAMLLQVHDRTNAFDEKPKDTNNIQISKAKEGVRIKALQKLRDYFLFENKLEGEILRVKFPKGTYEEVKEGLKPYMVYDVTFGKKLNKLLSEAYSIKLHRRIKTGETYLVFEDGKTNDLERELQNDYNNSMIYIRLFDNNEKK